MLLPLLFWLHEWEEGDPPPEPPLVIPDTPDTNRGGHGGSADGRNYSPLPDDYWEARETYLRNLHDKRKHEDKKSIFDSSHNPSTLSAESSRVQTLFDNAVASSELRFQLHLMLQQRDTLKPHKDHDSRIKRLQLTMKIAKFLYQHDAEEALAIFGS